MIRKPSETTVEKRRNMRGGAGEVTIRNFFSKEDFKAKVRLCASMSLPPGASIGLHQHETEDEVYIVTAGSGLLDDTKTQTPVSAGDAILTGRGESHAISNDGKTNLEIIAVIMCY